MWSCRLFLEMSTAFGFFLLSWRNITFLQDYVKLWQYYLAQSELFINFAPNYT